MVDDEPGSHPEGSASEEGRCVGGHEVLLQNIVQEGRDVQGSLLLLSLHLQHGLCHCSHSQQDCLPQPPPPTIA